MTTAPTTALRTFDTLDAVRGDLLAGRDEPWEYTDIGKSQPSPAPPVLAAPHLTLRCTETVRNAHRSARSAGFGPPPRRWSASREGRCSAGFRRCGG